ncbi:patatin-like phospholipase family protein [Paenibacillus turpanensis]|uniref:patatin-like phospholipase family protein n=1 Tax=Paenibacillus turpanensis TaxID=2689078 RepID=UPI00140A3C01
MKVNAVFEGGGVKGIGLVGAVKAAEKAGFTFHSVAGTSSGAIVAAFLAAGYTADEMKRMIISMPFANFIKPTWLHQLRIVGPGVRLFLKKGLHAGDALEKWVAEKLTAKGVRTFGDLPPQKLRVVASDISMGKMLVLPNAIEQYGFDPARLPIAKAVRMSTSIPYFFDPVILRMPLSRKGKQPSFSNQFIYIVDGAILSNFPLWLFDESEYQGPKLPTLGFMLVGKQGSLVRQINGPLSMLNALFSTMLGAHDERYIEDQYRYRTIKIPTLGVSTTEFDIKEEKSLELFDSGFQAGEKFIAKLLNDEQMIKVFRSNGRYMP